MHARLRRRIAASAAATRLVPGGAVGVHPTSLLLFTSTTSTAVTTPARPFGSAAALHRTLVCSAPTRKPKAANTKGRPTTRQRGSSSKKSPVAAASAPGAEASPLRVRNTVNRDVAEAPEEEPPLTTAAAASSSSSSTQSAVQHCTVQLAEAVEQWIALRQHCHARTYGSVTSPSAMGSSGGSVSGGSSSSARAPASPPGASSSSSASSSFATPSFTPGSAGGRGAPQQLVTTAATFDSTAAVGAAERATLLSTLAKDSKAYPQLHALFFPDSPPTSGSTRSVSGQNTAAVLVDDASATQADTNSSAAAAGGDAERSTVKTTAWVVTAVEPLLESETHLLELLTLLHAHVATAQESSSGATLHSALWDALIDELSAQLRSLSPTHNATSAGTTPSRSDVNVRQVASRSVAQVLHVLVRVHRHQLSEGGSSGTVTPQQLASAPSAASPSNSDDSGHSGKQQRKPRRMSKAKAQALQREADKSAALHARVARVLTELVAPTRQLCHALETEGGAYRDMGKEAKRDAAKEEKNKRGGSEAETAAAAGSALAGELAADAYGVASTCVMMTAISAVAEEAASALDRAAATFNNNGKGSRTAAPVEEKTQKKAMDGVSPPELRQWHRSAAERLHALLEQQKQNAVSANTSVTAAAFMFVDMLRCLRWIEELEVVLRVSTLSRVAELCQSALLLICRSAGTQADKTRLFELLCTPAVAAALQKLSRDRVTYAQAVTDLCSVADVYLQHHHEQLAALVDRVEGEHHRRLTELHSQQQQQQQGVGVWVPQRPPLHSPLAQLLYAMLCCGFEPTSLLTSSLCLSPSPRDTLEAVRAADTFSAQCGTAPLPVRTRLVLVDHVAQMVMQCRKNSHRVVVSSTDSANRPSREEEAAAMGASPRLVHNPQHQQPSSTSVFALNKRLAEAVAADYVYRASSSSSHLASGGGSSFAAASATTSYSSSATAKARRGERKGAAAAKSKHARMSALMRESEGDGTAGAAGGFPAASNSTGTSHSGGGGGGVLTPAAYRVEVNHALYVALESIVECVLRGDGAAVEQLTHALLPLLQQEGGEAAMTESLEYIWHSFKQRLAELGQGDVNALRHSGVTGSRKATSTKPSLASGVHSRHTPPAVVSPRRTTTAAMENALASLSALFMPHVTESAVKVLTGSSPSLYAASHPLPDGAAAAAAAAAATSSSMRSAGERAAPGGGGGEEEGSTTDSALLRHDELVEQALRLTTVCLLCGMPASTIAHLTTLHNALLKAHDRFSPAASAAASGSAPVTAAFRIVERLEQLLTDLTRQALPWARDPHSAYVRHGGTAVQQVLAVYIASTTDTVRDVTQRATTTTTTAAGGAATRASSSPSPGIGVSAQYRHYLLTVVHLLYRLSTEFPVEVEPAALRQFRVEALDPALTAVLASHHTPGSTSTSTTSKQLNEKKKKKTTAGTDTDGDDGGTAATDSGGASLTSAVVQLPLTTLTEVVVVMCVADSVQHVSPALLKGVVAAVERHLSTRDNTAAAAAATTTSSSSSSPSPGAVVDVVTGVLVTQLLSSAATLCLRADDALTGMLMQLLDRLGPMLTLWQTATVLERLQATGAPLPAPPVRRLLERLVVALQRAEEASTASSTNTKRKTSTAAAAEMVSRVAGRREVASLTARHESLTVAQRIRTLHLLSAIEHTAAKAVAEQRWQPDEDADVAALLRLLRDVSFAPLLCDLVQPSHLQRHEYSIGECGLMVETVAGILQAMQAEEADQAESDRVAGASRWSRETREALRQLPRSLAVYVLQAVQQPFTVHDIPLLLRGYAALSSERALQQQVLRAFISRTIRAAAAMTPLDVVVCVEAYCAGGVFHQQLYGVLLGRAADSGRRLTLELAVRLLRCGTAAGGGHAGVQTVCVTAVQPIFSAQVRSLLQSDPHMLVSVGATALAILHCLRDCFPHDAIGTAVLANIARYRHDASLAVLKAALELMERRGGADYDVAHVLARHCIERVLPACSAGELATVTSLLVACGLRSAALLEAVYARLAEVVDTISGSSLAKLSQGLLRAAVEVDSAAVQRICDRIIVLAAATPPPPPQLGDDGPPSATAAARKEKKRTRKGSSGTLSATTAASPGSSDAKAEEGVSPSSPVHGVAPSAGVAGTPAPLTLHQVCVLLHLTRSVGRRFMTTAMTTVDALLTYTQNRVKAEAALVAAADAQRMAQYNNTNDATPAAAAAAATASGQAEDDGMEARPVSSSSSSPLAADSLAKGHAAPVPSLPLLEDLSPHEVEEMLRTCIDLSTSPRAYGVLVQRLADHVAQCLREAEAASGDAAGGGSGAAPLTSFTPSPPSSSPSFLSTRSSSAAAASVAGGMAWYSDLILLVDLCNLLVRLGQSRHPAIAQLCEVMYERRGMLMQRALLVKTTKASLELAGREAHPGLYKLIVDGEVF